MKKKLAFILCIVILAANAVGCSAAEVDSDAWKENTGTIALEDLKVSGDGIAVDGNTVKITKGGDFEVTGELADGMIYVNTEGKVKLRLSGMALTNTSGPAIFFDNAEKAFITITEGTENFLTDGANYMVDDADAVLFSNDDLEIKGSGKLTVDGNFKHGIAGDDDVKIENGTIVISSYEHGIKVNDTLKILGGEFDITTETGKGMKAGAEVVVDDGKIRIDSKDEGIESKGHLTINGGDIYIVSDEDGMNTGNEDTSTENGGMMPEGFEGGRPGRGGMMPTEGAEGEQPPQGGAMPEGFEGGRPGRGGMMPTEGAEGEQPINENNGRGGRGGFGFVDEETAAQHAITINGGNIYISASGDGIDSNGNLTIAGGKVIVEGPENNGNGPLDCQGTMTISGGEVITLSSAGMIQLPRTQETQNTLRVVFNGNQPVGSTVKVCDAEGNQIMNITATRKYQALVFSSEKLETGKEYTVFVDDTEYQKVTVAQGISSVGMQNGGMGGNRFNQGGIGGNRFSTNGGNQNRIKVRLNNKEVVFAEEPVIKDGTTLVGFRAILEALGAEVGWDEKTQTVTAVKDDVTIVLKIGSKEAMVNGVPKTLLQAPEIRNGSTLIPVRFMSEEMGMKVEWNEAFQLISITSQN